MYNFFAVPLTFINSQILGIHDRACSRQLSVDIYAIRKRLCEIYDAMIMKEFLERVTTKQTCHMIRITRIRYGFWRVFSK